MAEVNRDVYAATFSYGAEEFMVYETAVSSMLVWQRDAMEGFIDEGDAGYIQRMSIERLIEERYDGETFVALA